MTRVQAGGTVARNGRARDRSTTVLLFPVLDFGGIESRAVIQAEGMAARGANVRVCCFADDGSAASAIRAVGVPVDVIGTRPSVRNPRALWRLWRYLRAHEVAILHTVTGAMTVHGMLAGFFAGVPVRIVEEVGIPDRGPFGRVLFPFFYRLATCVIGVSDSVVTFLVEEDGVEPRRARRVYNAIDSRFLEDYPRNADDTFRILTAGRLAPVKGHADLLHALAPLLSRTENVALSIAGEGSERTSLEALVRALGIERQVEFLGYRSDLPELLAASQLFVLPSRMEGFGLAVVEAMAARVPVVATRVGGVPEVFPDWAQEWLVDPGDLQALGQAIERVRALGPAERDDMGSRLRDHAAYQFGPARYIAELDSLYRELADATHPR